MVSRLAASFLFALFLLCAFHTTAAAQIILDGMITEPDWHQLGTSTGGPPPSFGTGHEINALYADINATHFYVGVAGNVQFGNRILVFIDSISGGCDSGNLDAPLRLQASVPLIRARSLTITLPPTIS